MKCDASLTASAAVRRSRRRAAPRPPAAPAPLPSIGHDDEVTPEAEATVVTAPEAVITAAAVEDAEEKMAVM